MFTSLSVTVLILLPAIRATPPPTSALPTTASSLPFFRSGSGTNVLPVLAGTPPQPVNLTLSTSFPSVLLFTDACAFCLSVNGYAPGLPYPGFDADDSSTLHADDASADRVTYTAVDPDSPTSLYAFEGRLASDALTVSVSPGTDLVAGPVLLVDRLLAPTVSPWDPSAPAAAAQALDTELPAGSVGFFGLGVDPDHPAWSPLNTALGLSADSATTASAGIDGFVAGLSIDTYQWYPGQQAGELHWGGIPSNRYVGDFVWLDAAGSRGGGWGVPIDSLEVNGETIGLSDYYGVLDPGYDEIWMPAQAAERFYSKVTNAHRSVADPTRWTVPCSTNISSPILNTSGWRIALAPAALVLPSSSAPAAGAAAGVCLGAVAAWPRGSVAENVGQVRLGTAFLSGVYVALYYFPAGSYVGLAGRAGSVNPSDLSSSSSSAAAGSDDGSGGGGGHANGKLAGILVGSLLAALAVGLGLLYARNASSFQSTWYRAMRRQRRIVENAVVRAATLPPVMPAPMGMMHPGMMGGMGMGMGMGMRPGLMGPMGMGMGMGVPPPLMRPVLGQPHVPHVPPPPPAPAPFQAPPPPRAHSWPSRAHHAPPASPDPPLSPQFLAGLLGRTTAHHRSRSHSRPTSSPPLPGSGPRLARSPQRQGPESYLAGLTGPGETGDAYGPTSTGVHHLRQGGGRAGGRQGSGPVSWGLARGGSG